MDATLWGLLGVVIVGGALLAGCVGAVLTSSQRSAPTEQRVRRGGLGGHLAVLRRRATRVIPQTWPRRR